jgi:hypothetical protein
MKTHGIETEITDKDGWMLKHKDVIMLLLPTNDGKYIVAKAVIEDKPIESLKDAIIELPESEGMGTLKFPVVLVRDIEILRQKLIEDFINRLGEECCVCGQSVLLNDEIESIINKRFRYV